MNLSIFIVFLIGMAGCTSPQAPVIQGTTIAGLSIPDTINFGVIRVGITKDSNVVFKNTGTDTIFITSQRFSNSEFKLSDTSKSHLTIPPGATQSVSIQFLPSDTSAVLGFDTIRTASKTNILMLRGGGVPFTSLAVLTVPDTINFGAVRAGIAKDSNIVFKNTGIDTLKITSQRFSDSSFKLSNASQNQMSIVPGATQTVGVQFLSSDTSSVLGYDTIRTPFKTKIIVLRGRTIPFSSLFTSAPTSVTVTLTGLLGKDAVAGNSTYNFSFYTSSGPQQWSDTLHFSFSYVDESNPTYGSAWDNSTAYDVWLHIDTVLREITWLKASYDYETDFWCNGPGCLGSHQTSSDKEGIVINSISLVKTVNGWSAQDTGSILNSIVSSAQYFKQSSSNMGTETQSQLLSITGFTNSAALSLTIQ
jgi:hypothetical protein